MRSAKVAITVREDLLTQLDRLVAEGRYPNRSQAIQAAVEEQLRRIRKVRLAEETAKLNPVEERALAEEGLGVESETWPRY